MLLLVVSARPTADQLAAWQREHHPPQAPTGKLELPDFQERGGRTVFELQAASPVKTFRLLNVGSEAAERCPKKPGRDDAEMTKGGAANSAADRVREVAIAAVAGADTTT